MDLFAPGHYQGVRRPVGEAETLPAGCYPAPEFYARGVDNNWVLDQVLDGPGRRRAMGPR